MVAKTRTYEFKTLASGVDERDLAIGRGVEVEYHQLTQSDMTVGSDEMPIDSARIAARYLVDRSGYDTSGEMRVVVHQDSRGVNTDGSLSTPYLNLVGAVVRRVSSTGLDSEWTDMGGKIGFNAVSSAVMVACGGGYTYTVVSGSVYRFAHSTEVATLLSPQTGSIAGSGAAVFNYVACSADGAVVIVGAQDGHYPSVSFDHGASWVAQTSLSPYDTLYASAMAEDGEILWVATRSAIYRRYRTQSNWALMTTLSDASLEWAQGTCTITGESSVWVARSRNTSQQATLGQKPLFIGDTGTMGYLNHYPAKSYLGVAYDTVGGLLYAMDYSGLIYSSTITDDLYRTHGVVPNTHRARGSLAIDHAAGRLWVVGDYATMMALPATADVDPAFHAATPGYSATWQSIAADTDGEVWLISNSALWRYRTKSTDDTGGGDAPPAAA